MKRIIVLVLLAALCICLLWQTCALPGGNYTAPIVSLTTKAPILAAVWLAHLLYFVFGVKTITAETQASSRQRHY